MKVNDKCIRLVAIICFLGDGVTMLIAITRIQDYCWDIYSVRKAVTGSKLAARMAGTTPATKPMITDKTKAPST